MKGHIESLLTDDDLDVLTVEIKLIFMPKFVLTRLFTFDALASKHLN